MTDVVISPSSQTANQYAGGATGVEDSESRHMRDIAPLLHDLLLRNGINSKLLLSTDLATRIKESNKLAPKLHFALHSNAGGTSYGASCWIYGPGGKSEPAAQAIQRELAAITPWPDLGVRVYNHYETRETISPAVIAEVAFHDKPEPAEWIRTHKRELAVALARGIIAGLAAAYGGRFVDIAARPLILDAGTGSAPVVIAPTPTPVPEEDDMYTDKDRYLLNEVLLPAVARLEQNVYALGQKVGAPVVDVDEDAIAAAVLAQLDPAKIVAAIPDTLAAAVADELARRLAG